MPASPLECKSVADGHDVTQTIGIDLSHREPSDWHPLKAASGQLTCAAEDFGAP